MGLFKYRFIDAKGKKKFGIIEAENIHDAKEKLRSQKLVLVSLQPQNSTFFTFFRSKKKETLKEGQLITFTTQLSQLLKAGMPLYESLLCLEEQYRSEMYHPIIHSLCEQIKKGSSLSQAMSQFPQSFNQLYCALIAAGESVGALDTSLEKLSTLLSKQRKIKKQLTTAMIYPAILFCFSLIVSTMLLTFVIPSLETLFEDRPVNGFTTLVMHISRFLTHQWPYYLPAAFLCLIGVIYLLNAPLGKRWVGRMSLSTPVLKTLITQTALARFSRTMGSLLQGGVTIIQALQISRKTMHNPFLEEAIEKAEARIIEGSLLSIELKKSPLIPHLLPRMLAIGEEGGNAASMFHQIADLYEEDIEKTLTRVTALAQPVILVIMGGIVGLIMLAVLLPLTDVNAFL